MDSPGCEPRILRFFSGRYQIQRSGAASCGSPNSECAVASMTQEPPLALFARSASLNCVRRIGIQHPASCILHRAEGWSGGDARIRTGDKGFAGPCLTTWPRRLRS